MGGAGAATGFNQSGFVGRSDNASRFVGNARAGQATAGGNNNVRTFNANNFNSDSFSNNRNGNAANANSPLSRFRPMQKVAFEYAASTPVVIQARAQALVEKTLVKLPPVPNSSVEVTMEESEAVLKGTVARERDKMLLEQLLRLEPGVRSIRNELTVTSPQPAL